MTGLFHFDKLNVTPPLNCQAEPRLSLAKNRYKPPFDKLNMTIKTQCDKIPSTARLSPVEALLKTL